jgi:chitin disaccharide deacetylase
MRDEEFRGKRAGAARSRAGRGDRRRLVIVADDFGRRRSINRAISEAYDAGTITSASLMAGGEAFQEAVRISRSRPGLSLGLHVTLCDGNPTLPPDRIPDLVGTEGRFRKHLVPLSLGALTRKTCAQIESEVKSQFDRLEKEQIRPAYVDGHHHLHIHPLIFRIVCKEASARGVGWVRLPSEPLPFVSGRAFHRLPEWVLLRTVALYDRSVARAFGMHTARWTFGTSGTGKIDEKYLHGALKNMGKGVNEIFFHPDKGSIKGRVELNCFASLGFRRHLVSLGIELTNYSRILNE